MKFTIGDPVYIKSNQEEGKLEEYIGKDMASVKVGKSTYHVFLDDLEHPYLRWFLQKEKKSKSSIQHVDQLRTEKNYSRQRNLPQGVYLVFMPIYDANSLDEKVEKLKVYIYNETMYEYLIEYNCTIKSEFLFSLSTTIYPESEFYMHDISFEEMASSPLFAYRFVDNSNAKLDLATSLQIKPKKLFDKLDNIKYENKAFFYFLLFDVLKPRAKQEVFVATAKTLFLPNEKKNNSHFDFEGALKKSMYEIDLHIENLISHHRTLGNSEMLNIQLKECQKALDLAIATKQYTIIFIHGVGNGKLKKEIHLLLDQTKYVHKYVNDYDIQYGYGATQVFFRY